MLLMLLFINTNFITLIATTNSREREQVQEYHTTIMEDNNLLEADEIANYKKRDSFIHSYTYDSFIRVDFEQRKPPHIQTLYNFY